MSTIASPRDPSGPFPRRTNSSIITPTSSSRPSLDTPASASGSPITAGAAASSSTATTQSKRANRAALREYYNLRNGTTNTKTPIVEITDHQQSYPFPPLPNQPATTTDPLLSALDTPTFDAQAYVSSLRATASLPELLRAHARVRAEARALDAEREALVYDNYSKLIAATETIRRMRGAASSSAASGGGVDGGGTGTGMGEGQGKKLEEVVEGIYQQAVGLREEVRRSVASAQGAAVDGQNREREERRERTRLLTKEVVKVPARLRRLVEEGREAEARREWVMPRRLLERWRELGVGGDGVAALIEEGDAALGEGGGAGEAGTTAA